MRLLGLCDILPYVRTLLATVLAAGALLTAGCSAAAPDTAPSGTGVPVTDPKLAKLVPPSIRDDGLLTIATDPGYPPMEFRSADGRSVEGVDIDLASAVAAVLDLQPEFEDEAFTAIPDTIRTGRYELGIASLTVRRGRSRDTNAVLYFMSGTRLARSPRAVDLTPTTMCGHSIAAVEGSTQVIHLAKASDHCRERGQSAISIQAFSDQTQVTDAVVTGTAQGMLADSPVAADAVSSHPGELELSGPESDPAPFGMLTAPEFPRLARAVKRATQQLMDSGYYDAVLARWSVEDGAIDRAAIVWADDPRRR